jgi:glycine/D-amino acid oxidase-like deaminating enzyme
MELVKNEAEFSPSIIANEAYPCRIMLRVPLADVNFYRPFLFRLFEKLGGKLEQRKIESFTELTGSYDAIINCSGWETRYLQRDARVHPIRGQTTILEVPTDYKIPISFGNGHLNAYAIFRPESRDCVIGTTYKVNDSKTAISPKEREEIFAKVSAFLPDIRQFKVKQEKVGLRCGRQDVRIQSEWLSYTLLVHCYGHNSSGFSASWASAKEVLKLCEAAFTIAL